MGEAKVGAEFVKHEFDEAIAIQRTIVDAEGQLEQSHPEADAKKVLRQGRREDEKYLAELERLGREHGATGKVEEIAGGLKQLMTESLENAKDGVWSEVYEAHAVLLNLKRKQQDSASAMVKMGRTLKDTELRDAATAFEKGTKAHANELATSLAALAVKIATEGRNGNERRATARR
jgi:hypothetical protein